MVGEGIRRVRVGVNWLDCFQIAFPSCHPFPTSPLALYALPRYFSSLLLSKQDGMLGAGPECQKQNQKTLPGRGGKRNLRKDVLSLYVSPLPLSPPPTKMSCDSARGSGKSARSGRGGGARGLRLLHLWVTPFQGCQAMPTLTPTCPDLGEFCPPPPRLG